jgi:hypothetical protein
MALGLSVVNIQKPTKRTKSTAGQNISTRCDALLIVYVTHHDDGDFSVKCWSCMHYYRVDGPDS